MFNPFKKHTEEHDDIWDLLTNLTFTVDRLSGQIGELQEEVNYLIHIAEEAEDLDD